MKKGGDSRRAQGVTKVFWTHLFNCWRNNLLKCFEKNEKVIIVTKSTSFFLFWLEKQEKRRNLSVVRVGKKRTNVYLWCLWEIVRVSCDDMLLVFSRLKDFVIPAPPRSRPLPRPPCTPPRITATPRTRTKTRMSPMMKKRRQRGTEWTSSCPSVWEPYPRVRRSSRGNTGIRQATPLLLYNVTPTSHLALTPRPAWSILWSMLMSQKSHISCWRTNTGQVVA